SASDGAMNLALLPWAIPITDCQRRVSPGPAVAFWPITTAPSASPDTINDLRNSVCMRSLRIRWVGHAESARPARKDRRQFLAGATRRRARSESMQSSGQMRQRAFTERPLLFRLFHAPAANDRIARARTEDLVRDRTT